ncbi:SdpI family protein [Halpernia frigidisoli]|uniref:SdpI/YhfL protein family protein n=1 Tax=Halpernia frigidisoli TaxID=1125876 RepID=A0A1I3JI81_9FLAO|nr:SdpI family protein [Halpernia frigidisoli]SFI59830.1 SdpI/YhfL protein family protein [Halpernia frigidisoli]
MKINESLNIMFENPLINITFFGGLIFIVAGFIMYKFPPKNINSLYGYRTSSSMENQEKWDFAQNYSSKEMMKLGFLLSISCLFSLITNFDNLTNMFIGLGLMILMLIILLLRVEKAIKIKFSEK